MTVQDHDWDARIHAAQHKTYKLHCLTYGKLMQRDDPYGKIVGRVEHQRTAQTTGFPDDLLPYCSQAFMVPGWTGVTSSIRKPWQDAGAFVLRTVTTDTGISYHIFCKIAAWPEDSSKPTARVFTHMNLWCVEVEEFDLMAALPILHYMFWPNKNREYYPLTVPATEKLKNRLVLPPLELNFGKETDYWDYLSDIVHGDVDVAKYLTSLNSKERLKGTDTTVSTEALFLLADLKVWDETKKHDVNLSVGINHVPNHLENPFSRQFFGDNVPVFSNDS